MHADADDAEADAVAGRDVSTARRNGIGIDEEFWSDGGGAGETGGALEELTASEIVLHFFLQET